MPIGTIPGVLQALDAILDRAWNEQDRNGYFAALYRRVTRAVKDGIAEGSFQNGALMERLDVIFANRYLDAYHLFRTANKPSSCWFVAFEAASRAVPLVLQQLLAGMNAHINLDLGIAAAEVSPGDQLPGLQTDFDQINAILAAQVGAVEKEIAKISPLIGLLERLGLRTETKIINFDLVLARNLAWDSALKFAVTPTDQLDAAIAELDARVEIAGRLIVSPPLVVDVELAPIRAVESANIRRNLDVLMAA